MTKSIKAPTSLWMVPFFIFAAGPVWAATGEAEIRGTAEGSAISGKAHLADTDSGLKITVDFKNVPPGTHGFHIHENGSCGDAGSAAGGHYNPNAAPHGFLPKDGFGHAHAGDFGNVEISPDGSGTVEMLLPGLTLTGENNNVAGKAFILHEKADDFGQPTGNAGGRIACGQIQLTETK